MRLTESQLRRIVRKALLEQEEKAEGGAMSAADVTNAADLRKYFLSLSKNASVGKMPAAQAPRVAKLVDELIKGGSAGEFSSSEVDMIDKGLAKVAKSTE